MADGRLDGPPADVRPRGLAEGMAVQDRLASLAGPVLGWKIAATTAYAQEHLGVDGPLPGLLFSRFRHAEGEPEPVDTMTTGVVKPEFAFRMADPDSSPSLGAARDAVDMMFLALEMPDSRYTSHRTACGPQLLADAACAGRFVEGPPAPAGATWTCRPARLSCRLRARNSRAAGAPSCWATRDWPCICSRRNCRGSAHAPRSGDVVTGTATTPAPIAAGAKLTADFGELGAVAARFVAVNTA